MPKSIDEIAGEIMSDMEKLLLERVYIAIINKGNVLYASTALDKHIELLKLFGITEFKKISNYGHAFPLSGTNLAVFKISEDILVALYIKKGYQGQLLSFKTKINYYFSDLSSAVELPVTARVESKSQILPKLTQNVSLTLGLSEDESAVLKLCDGNHSVKEMIDKTRIPRKKIVDIIRRYENKKWLRLDSRGEVDMIPLSIKKFPETAVRLGMISKKSYDINELCDGTHTVQDISQILSISDRELKKNLTKMEKNKIIKMTVKIPEEEPSSSREATQDRIIEPELTQSPELSIKPEMAASISFTMGFDENEKKVLKLLDGAHTIVDLHQVTQMDIIKIFKILFKYEEKGWVKIPIDDFMLIVGIKEKLRSELDSQELNAKYIKLLGLKSAPSEATVENAVELLTQTQEMENERENLFQLLQAELPLMPENAKNKLVDRLLHISKKSRDAMLAKLINSESSRKFRRPIAPLAPPPVSTPPTTPIASIPKQTLAPPPAYPASAPLPTPPAFAPPPAPIRAPPPTTSVITPVIDETPLLKPSALLGSTPQTGSAASPQTEELLSPSGQNLPPLVQPVKLKVGGYQEETSPAPPKPAPSEPLRQSDLLTGRTPAEEDQISNVLSFIDSLLGIPEIQYLALIDYGGAIFYQTTKEAELWDISMDTLKMIQNWKSGAPSIFLGDHIKYACIKCDEEMLIATNIKGLGHIVAIPINEKLFILTKVSKEGDALLIADDVGIVAKQINEMFHF